MITVVSLSPAIDKRLEFDEFRVGGTNRVRCALADGAGKGVDVALALAALSEEVRMIGVLPGGGALVTERLERNGVPYGFLETPGAVRTNLKLLDRQSGMITEVNEPVAAVPEALLEAVLERVAGAAKESRAIVLTGSLPEGCPPDLYARMIRKAREAAPECKAVLDADGERFRLGTRAMPWLVKPNLAELEGVAGRPLASRGEISQAAKGLLSMGAEIAVVSLGAEGALAISREEAFFAPAIEAKIVTTTGAGDAMVAGLLHGFHLCGTLSAALCHGIAAATARCAFGGDQFIDAKLYARFLNDVRIEKLC